jgi:hypothetical protein
VVVDAAENVGETAIRAGSAPVRDDRDGARTTAASTAATAIDGIGDGVRRQRGQSWDEGAGLLPSRSLVGGHRVPAGRSVKAVDLP